MTDLTQEVMILSYLKTGRSLTPMDALERFGCFRLAARVSDLRELGHKIQTELVTDEFTGKRFASYSLPLDDRELDADPIEDKAGVLGTGYSRFTDIPMFKYGMIMADVPWTYKNWSEKGEGKNASAQYDCMTLDDIKSLRVGDIASKDCILFLWATNPLLREAFDVMDAWGFTFCTAGHWSKKTVNNKQAFGTGYVLRSAGEPFLIGRMGDPWTSKSVRSVIEGKVRGHSQKPDEAFTAAEVLAGDVDRIELFSRQRRVGWSVYGNELDKFEART